VEGGERLAAGHRDADLGIGLRHLVRALLVELEHDANDGRIVLRDADVADSAARLAIICPA
jgi:hypothetical protein